MAAYIVYNKIVVKDKEMEKIVRYIPVFSTPDIEKFTEEEIYNFIFEYLPQHSLEKKDLNKEREINNIIKIDL